MEDKLLSREEIVEFCDEWISELYIGHEFSLYVSPDNQIDSDSCIVSVGISEENENPEVRNTQRTQDFLKVLNKVLKSVKHHMGGE